MAPTSGGAIPMSCSAGLQLSEAISQKVNPAQQIGVNEKAPLQSAEGLSLFSLSSLTYLKNSALITFKSSSSS
jgi:hypothetical protein